MPTPAPRPRGDGSLQGRLREDRKDREQIRRLLSKPAVPKPPAPVAGGGIVGMAEVRSTAGSVVFASGQSRMAYTGVTYDAPFNPNATGASLSWLNVSGYQIFVEPGWYIPVLTIACIWTNGGAPASFGGPYMNGGPDSAHNNYPIFPNAPMGSGLSGFVQPANFGPTYIKSGSDLHAELRAIGGAATGDNDPSQSYAIWNITKLG